MNRRLLILGLVSAVAGLSSPAQTQQVQVKRIPWVVWQEIPSIAVISIEDDSRVIALREAVDFWNTEFATLGSPFRLGAIVHSLRTIVADDLRALRAWTSSAGPFPSAILASIKEASTDMIVALSDGADFNAYAFPFPSVRKVLIAIPSLWKYRRVAPGVERNVIAHELGHAVGLSHNDDATTLMCGGSRCQNLFPNQGFFPLTSAEKTKLLEMYPPNWEPKPSRRWKADPPTRISG
jgi:hypothetical protein